MPRLGRGLGRPDSFLLLWPVAHQGMHSVGGWEGGASPGTVMENKTSSNTKTFSVFNLNQIRMRRKWNSFVFLSEKK